MTSQDITAVAGIRLPRLVEVLQLARTGCQHGYEPALTDVEAGHTGGPRCGDRTWSAERGTAGAEVGGDES